MRLSQQLLVELVEHHVHLVDVMNIAQEAVFDDDVELGAMGQRETGAGEQCEGVFVGKSQREG